jgi:hypothetical protein
VRLSIATVGSDVFFVTTLQGWAYKTQPTREMPGWSSDVFFVTTLQGWVYKTQPTRKMDAWMIVWCFLCNNIARMGLQNTTNKRDACEQSDAFFVTILQGWAYKTQPTREMEACEQSDAFFVTTLQGWVYKNTTNTWVIVWFFLCNIIARMGLQNTTNKRDGCMDDRLMFSL